MMQGLLIRIYEKIWKKEKFTFLPNFQNKDQIFFCVEFFFLQTCFEPSKTELMSEVQKHISSRLENF